MWQTIVRLGDDFVNAQSQEVEGRGAVSAVVLERIPEVSLGDPEVIVDLTSYCCRWNMQMMKAERKLSVTRD